MMALTPFHSPKEGGRMMARLLRAMARLDAHWAGDLIGAVSLFSLLFIGLFIGAGLGVK